MDSKELHRPELKVRTFIRSIFSQNPISLILAFVLPIGLVVDLRVRSLFALFVILVAQWGLGAESAASLLQRRLDWLEAVVFGGTFGMLWTVSLNQVAVALQMPMWIVTACSFGLLAAARHQRLRREQNLLSRGSPNVVLVVPVIGLSLVAVAPGLSWTTLAGTFVLIVWAFERHAKRLQSVTPWHQWVVWIFGAVSGLIVAIAYLRDSSWTLVAWQDWYFFEALGVLVSQHGAWAGSPVLADVGVVGYHWLTYGWYGYLSTLSGLQPMEFQTHLLTFIGSAITYASLLSIFRRMGISVAGSIIAATVSTSVAGFHSLELATVFLAAALQFSLSSSADTAQIMGARQMIGVWLLAVGAVFAKGTSVVAAASILLAGATFTLAKPQRFHRTNLHALLNWVLSNLALGVVFIAKYQSTVTEFEGDERTGVIKYVFDQGLWALVTNFLGQVISIGLLVVMSLLAVGLVFAQRRTVTPENQGTFHRSVWLATVSGISTCLTGAIWSRDLDTDSFGFISSHAGWMTSLALVAVSVSLLPLQLRLRTTGLHVASVFVIATLVIASAIAALFLRTDVWQASVVPQIWGLTEVPHVLKMLLVDHIFVAITLALAVVLSIVFSSTSRTNRYAVLGSTRRFTLLATTVALSFGALATVTQYVKTAEARGHSRTADTPHSNVDINWPVKRSDALIALGRFVREFTPKEALFASNNFCCPGENWFLASELGVPTSRLDDFGGANFQLPAETQRRFLAQGLLFLGADFRDNRRLTEDERNRMLISLSFANSPSMSDVESLRRYGVEYFIVNLQQTEREDWSGFAVELFRNEQFVLLQLVQV